MQGKRRCKGRHTEPTQRQKQQGGRIAFDPTARVTNIVNPLSALNVANLVVLLTELETPRTVASRFSDVFARECVAVCHGLMAGPLTICPHVC